MQLQPLISLTMSTEQALLPLFSISLPSTASAQDSCLPFNILGSKKRSATLSHLSSVMPGSFPCLTRSSMHQTRRFTENMMREVHPDFLCSRIFWNVWTELQNLVICENLVNSQITAPNAVWSIFLPSQKQKTTKASRQTARESGGLALHFDVLSLHHCSTDSRISAVQQSGESNPRKAYKNQPLINFKSYAMSFPCKEPWKC